MLKIIYPNCYGIDVHKTFVVVGIVPSPTIKESLSTTDTEK